MIGRRALIAGAAGLLALAPWPRGPRAANHHDKFAAEAERMRKQAVAAGDQSYGAVVVKDGKIIGWGPSRLVTDRDPTAHAEMTAIRDACRRLGTRDLSGCTLYSTTAPCAMCGTAAYWSGLDRVMSGDPLRDLGPPRYGC